MLFKTIRSLICPFNELERYVPKQGNILDVGCGHGIFSAILAQKSRRRKVLGIDPSEYKIKLARQDLNTIPNLKFKISDLKSLRGAIFNCIVIIDVLYLLPDSEKKEIFKKIKQMLKKNGLLILKEVNTSPKWLFYLIRFEEYLMVKILKYTFSDKHQLYFLSKEEYRKMLYDLGFKINEEKEIQRFFYRHMIFSIQVA